MKKELQLRQAVERYGDMLYRIAMSVLGQPEDAEDAVQNTFLRYYRKAPDFRSDEHEKAWLIRCGVNASKSIHKARSRHYHEELETVSAVAAPRAELPELLFYLPVSERILLQLRYVEDYTAEEMAELLKKSPAAVRKSLERARKRAREIYEKEFI